MEPFAKFDLTRRDALRTLGGAGAATAQLLAPRAASAFSDLELLPPLRSHTKKSGIRFGCAANQPVVLPDAVFLQKLATEANIYVPEGCMKWLETEPHPGRFEFSGPDNIADFAARHDMMVHGHTLVWHEAIPDWVSRLSTARDAEIALERHIGMLVPRYRGKIWVWDVVNEPLEPKDGLELGLRNTVWQRLLGAGYIDRAFRLARAADPQTPLCLNEFGIEYADSASYYKRQALLALLRKLRDLKTPIEYLGLQAHLKCDQTFERRGLTAFLRGVVDLGYKLLITELDVNDVRIRGSDVERDTAIDSHVNEFLEIVFSVARPASISTWGLSDRFTWMKMYYNRTDGRPLRPLPLDVNYDRKKLWATIGKYLSA